MTPAFRKACEAGINCCNEHRLTVEFLEKLAEAEPAWADRAKELRDKLEQVQQIAETGIFLMDEMSK